MSGCIHTIKGPKVLSGLGRGPSGFCIGCRFLRTHSAIGFTYIDPDCGRTEIYLTPAEGQSTCVRLDCDLWYEPIRQQPAAGTDAPDRIIPGD